jgi:hypothetical protein
MKQVLDLFNAIVIDTNQSATVNYVTNVIEQGYILNFEPTDKQEMFFKENDLKLPVQTLFSVEERENASLNFLLTKQFIHYLETYGHIEVFQGGGSFNLVNETQEPIVSLKCVVGITEAELGEKVRKLMYSNSPVKDVLGLKAIIDKYLIQFNVNLIENNELKVLLFDANNDTFNSGDDAVRYIIYRATDDTLLIKSREVLEACKNCPITPSFYSRNAIALAKVFNRHKAVLMSVKNKSNKTQINYISRLSKIAHEPLKQSWTKTFVADAIAGRIPNVMELLSKASLRDKFKFLNLLEYKTLQLDVDVFSIRNGKVFTKTENVKTFPKAEVILLQRSVLDSIKVDLMHLKDKKILLDANVDYGLPISRKQTLGNLPFGTKIHVASNAISSGIYWHRDGGAIDLDLSTVDADGNRTGWGTARGYDGNQPVTYSGDIVTPMPDAMEFMTSSDAAYGVIVNIYNGEINSKASLVVGAKTKGRWIQTPIIQEEFSLQSSQVVLGFVKGTTFTVFSGRTGNKNVSASGKNPMIEKGLNSVFSLQDVFDIFEIAYDKVAVPGIEYDHNLTYSSFSYDKLEALLSL